MIKVSHTILIALGTSILCVCLYHFMVSDRFNTIDQNYARLVAASDQKNAPYESFDDLEFASTEFISPARSAVSAVVSIEAIERSNKQWKRDKYSRTNGSGVIISSNGYIVTNAHVVENADEISLILEDKREFKAEFVGGDQSTDIALLKIDAQELPYLQFGNSDELQIGEWVLAIGNPFRLSSSVTAGIVSAKARAINIFKRQGIESFIQTDAAVNPGNSGGALINTRSELMGINTAILTYSGKYEGFSFAIPSNLVNKVISDIREHGAVQRAWLGLSILDVDENIAEDLGLEKIEGVFVDLVEREGAASVAGLRYKDVITALDGKTCYNRPKFLELLGQYRPGDMVIISYLRNGKASHVQATLLNQMNSTDYIAVRREKIFTDLGFELRDLDSEEVKENGKDGVMVVSIYKDSKIANTNMEPGYIINRINGKQVESVNQLKEIMEASGSEVNLDGFYENYPRNWPYRFSK